MWASGENTVEFSKYHGLGNDVIVIEEGDLPSPMTPELASSMCDRRLGIGADQIMLMKKPKQQQQQQQPDEVDRRLAIFNADGSKAEACGNGTRCVVEHLASKSGKRRISLLSPTGKVLLGERHVPGDVEVDQGRPELLGPPLRLGDHGMEGEVGVPVSVGNPHLVIFLKNKKHLENFEAIGAKLERHPFFPNRTNVEFCSLEDDNSGLEDAKTARVWMWERGAGRTRACGSGGCAVAFAHFSRDGNGTGRREMKVAMEGGELTVSVDEKGRVRQRGEAVMVYTGKYRLSK